MVQPLWQSSKRSFITPGIPWGPGAQLPSRDVSVGEMGPFLGEKRGLPPQPFGPVLCLQLNISRGHCEVLLTLNGSFTHRSEAEKHPDQVSSHWINTGTRKCPYKAEVFLGSSWRTISGLFAGIFFFFFEGGVWAVGKMHSVTPPPPQVCSVIHSWVIHRLKLYFKRLIYPWKFSPESLTVGFISKINT